MIGVLFLIKSFLDLYKIKLEKRIKELDLKIEEQKQEISEND
jgi:hypothetical protein